MTLVSYESFWSKNFINQIIVLLELKLKLYERFNDLCGIRSIRATSQVKYNKMQKELNTIQSNLGIMIGISRPTIGECSHQCEDRQIKRIELHTKPFAFLLNRSQLSDSRQARFDACTLVLGTIELSKLLHYCNSI